MSDSDDKSGGPRDNDAAPRRLTWEARLEIARKQRAEALAQSNANQAGKPVSAEVETPSPRPQAQHLSTLERAVTPQAVSPEIDRGRKGRESNSAFPKVLATALIVAFVLWGGSTAISSWDKLAGNRLQTPSDPGAILGSLFSGAAYASETRAPVQLTLPDMAPDLPRVALRPTPPERDLPYAPAARVFLPELTGREESSLGTTPPLISKQPDVAQTAFAFYGPGTESRVSVPALAPSQTLVLATFHPLPVEVARAPRPVAAQTEPDIVPQVTNIALTEPIQAIEPLRAELDTPPVARPAINSDVSLFVPNRVPAETGTRALNLLSGGQANIVDTARVGFSVRDTQVRYYHQQDADVAAAAAEALGGISRDFTGAARKTRPGHIEVYLEGNGRQPTQRPSAQPSQFEQFIARLLNANN